jgi:hypothetical protein
MTIKKFHIQYSNFEFNIKIRTAIEIVIVQNSLFLLNFSFNIKLNKIKLKNISNKEIKTTFVGVVNFIQ